jgi:hypothetical protein
MKKTPALSGPRPASGVAELKKCGALSDGAGRDSARTTSGERQTVAVRSQCDPLAQLGQARCGDKVKMCKVDVNPISVKLDPSPNPRQSESTSMRALQGAVVRRGWFPYAPFRDTRGRAVCISRESGLRHPSHIMGRSAECVHPTSLRPSPAECSKRPASL